jgi:sugar/nucleoside kinase (ribokinase family)
VKPPTIITMGVHVVDVLARPISEIPEGQGGALVEQIRATAAGTAAGTALTVAKLGADCRCAGAIGQDALGDLLIALLEQAGIDTTMIRRRADAQTSASVLPIRPNGDRPAFHVVGANATFTPDDVDFDAFASADHLHLGGPEFMGGEHAATILRAAREAGATTSVDLLAPGDPGVLEWIGAALPYVDYFLPNDDQLRGFTGIEDLAEAGRALIDRGVATVAVTCGDDGALVIDGNGTTAVPAFPIDVVDTTGCGDAFSAGFIVGRNLGRDGRASAQLGCAAASFVAQGLGSDHGAFTLDDADRLIAAGR